MLAWGEIARVFYDSFAHLEGEIQAWEAGVALFEVLNDSK
jgi:hypothetical protein